MQNIVVSKGIFKLWFKGPVYHRMRRPFDPSRCATALVHNKNHGRDWHKKSHLHVYTTAALYTTPSLLARLCKS